MLPGVFEETIFSKRIILPTPRFIRAMHPKTEIRPERESIRRILEAGWVGQLKIHGHRAQIHISEDPSEPIVVYNRHGDAHKKLLTNEAVSELRRIFTPEHGWNVLDAEWIKSDEKIYVFDFLKKEDQLLNRMSFTDRWKLLPRSYLSPVLQTLPILKTVEQCLEAFERTEEFIEGLVFKSMTPGFEDTSIVRCRKIKA